MVPTVNKSVDSLPTDQSDTESDMGDRSHRYAGVRIGDLATQTLLYLKFVIDRIYILFVPLDPSRGGARCRSTMLVSGLVLLGRSQFP